MENLTQLSNEELLCTDGGLDGGGFWGDLAYAVAYVAHSAIEISNSISSNSSFGNANVYK